MEIIDLVKGLVLFVLVGIFILFAYMTRTLPAIKMILINILMLLVFLVLGYVATIGVNIGLKSAKMVGSVKQSRLLSSERLNYRGRVKNTGNYTIDHVYVTAKVVDNVSGTKKSSLRGEGDTAGSLEHDCVAIKGLRKGETRSFSCNMHYPPSYVRADVHFSLSWD